MKKNKMMRIASVLLVAVLISTCAISGTFAKYVTKVSGEDKARVAKWGIVLTMTGDELFAKEYEADDETFTGSENSEHPGMSVVSSNEEKLVAPGTKSKKDAFVATVKGTPEVATRYTLKISKGWTDVVLPAGTYTDYTQLVPTTDADGKTTYGYTKSFELEKDYAPVKWDIKVSKGSTSMSLTQAAQAYPALAAAMGGTALGFSATDAKTIVSTYKTQLEALILTMVSGASNAVFTVNDDGSIELSMDFDAGKEMDFSFELAWAWDFDDNGAGTNDKADTYLGNLAAEVEGIVKPEGASTEISFTFEASATQID